ncbi:hypothetical protein pKMKP103_CDS0169 [Klebsiella phage pKMKP103]|nr:hypothetical protein pKMKP103_CDS0169 [Klebsiella phage pKMKP103]
MPLFGVCPRLDRISRRISVGRDLARYISHLDYNWKIRLTEGPHSLNRGRPLPTGGIFKSFHESS